MASWVHFQHSIWSFLDPHLVVTRLESTIVAGLHFGAEMLRS